MSESRGNKKPQRSRLSDICQLFEVTLVPLLFKSTQTSEAFAKCTLLVVTRSNLRVNQNRFLFFFYIYTQLLQKNNNLLKLQHGCNSSLLS